MPVPYTFIKDKYYYYLRRVPKRLQHHYRTKNISFSLRTKSCPVAARRAAVTTDKLDNFWFQLDISSRVQHIGLKTTGDTVLDSTLLSKCLIIIWSIKELIVLKTFFKAPNSRAHIFIQ